MKLERIIRLPKKTISTILILCGLTASIPFTLKAYNNHSYNNYINKGQECLSRENYKEAVFNFDNALKYNKSEADEINKLIDRAVMLNASMNNFEEGAKLYYNKKYTEAISAFEKVNKEDTLRYDVAQEKIKECKREYSASNITAAKNEAINHNYEKAIIYLNLVLKLDPENQEAISLKSDYTNRLITIASK